MIETGNYVHTTFAHKNNVYKVLEVGDGWLYVDDNTVAGLSIPTESATLHGYCGNKWCNACHYATYDVKTGDVEYFVRETGVKFANTAYGRLLAELDKHGIDRDEILKDVDPADEKTVNALLFFAERITTNVVVK